MKVELNINGRIAIRLTPETEIERVVLKEAHMKADKGAAIRFVTNGVDGYVVSVEG